MKSWFSICIVSLLFILNSAFGKESYSIRLRTSDLLFQTQRHCCTYKSLKNTGINFSNQNYHKILSGKEDDYTPEEAYEEFFEPPFSGKKILLIAGKLVGGFLSVAFGGSGAIVLAEAIDWRLTIPMFVIGGSTSSAWTVYSIGNWIGKEKGSFKTTLIGSTIAGLTGFGVNYAFANGHKTESQWTDIIAGTFFFNLVLIPIGSTIGYNISTY